jgi:hypothetical protein
MLNLPKIAPPSSAKTGRASRWRRLLAGIAALTMSGGIAITAAAPAHAAWTSNPCDYGVVIGVRGTDAAPGSGTQHSGRLYASGGWGPQFDSLMNNIGASDLPMFHAGLVYPAGGADYFSSVDIGAMNLVNELNYLSTLCGVYAPSVVLLGHSQGAAVVLKALADPVVGAGSLTSAARAMIRAVIVYGDPQFTVNQPINSVFSESYANGRFGGRSQGELDNLANWYRVWWWPQGSSNPNKQWVYRIRSYCLSNDYWCATGGSMDVHNSYASNFTGDAWNFIYYMMTSSN